MTIKMQAATQIGSIVHAPAPVLAAHWGSFEGANLPGGPFPLRSHAAFFPMIRSLRQGLNE